MVKKLSFLTVLFVLVLINSCTTSNPTSPGGGGTQPTTIPWLVILNDYGAEVISYINLENDSIYYNIIGTGEMPHDIIVFNNMIYIVNSNATPSIASYKRNNDSLVLVKTGNVGATVNPHCIETDGKKLFITCFNSDEVVIVNPESLTIENRVNIGKAPEDIYYLNGYLYIACTAFE